MFFIILNSRTNTYYNAAYSGWTPHLVCATFFDFQTQADEIVESHAKPNGLITLIETEDLSKANIDLVVDTLADI